MDASGTGERGALTSSGLGATDASNLNEDGGVCVCVVCVCACARACARVCVNVRASLPRVCVRAGMRVRACVSACVCDVFAICDNNISPKADNDNN